MLTKEGWWQNAGPWPRLIVALVPLAFFDYGVVTSAIDEIRHHESLPTEDFHACL